MIDRFCLLPIEVKQLFSAARLRLRARALGIVHIEVGPEGGRIELGPKPDIDVGELLNLIQRQPDRFTLSGEHRLRLLDHHPEPDARHALIDALLTQLTPKARPQ
jgi:transcription-repair coupling factor (superfamily II helicase)